MPCDPLAEAAHEYWLNPHHWQAPAVACGLGDAHAKQKLDVALGFL